MKNLLYIFLLIPCLLFSQSLKRQVIASTGGSYSIDGISIRTTVAQPPGSTTFSNANNYLRQGFQQPNSCNYMDVPTVEILEQTPCFSDNSFDLTYSGENASIYEYNWTFDSSASISTSDSSTVNNLSFTESGEHIIELEISHELCSESTQFILVVDDSLEMNYYIQDASCNGEDGVIDVNANGGNPDYLFDFGIGYSSTPIAYLPQGDYLLSVQDESGCVISESFTIAGPESLSIELSTTPEYCNQENGTAQVEVLGGTEPYNSEWSNGVSGLIDSISNLNSSTAYSLLLNDANDCSDSISFNIAMIDGVIADVSTTPEYCSQANGTATAIGIGGTEPYTFEWYNGETTSTVEYLNSMAVYYLLITDDNDCADSVSFSVGFMGGVEILSSEIIHESCVDANDGEIAVELNDPIDTQIEWSNGQTDITTINSLEPGMYSFTVLDENNCIDSQDFEVEQADSIEVESIVDFIACTDEEGTIELTINGGEQPYFVEWTNGEIGELLIVDSTGVYEALIIDNNDCEQFIEIEIDDTEGNEDCLFIPSGFSPNFDSYNDTWEVQGLENFEKTSVKIFNRWGQLIYENHDYQNEWDGNNINGKELPFGAYFYVLELENSNVYTGDITLKR